MWLMWLLSGLHMCCYYSGMLFDREVSGDQNRQDSCMTAPVSHTHQHAHTHPIMKTHTYRERERHHSEIRCQFQTTQWQVGLGTDLSSSTCHRDNMCVQHGPPRCWGLSWCRLWTQLTFFLSESLPLITVSLHFIFSALHSNNNLFMFFLGWTVTAGVTKSHLGH